MVVDAILQMNAWLPSITHIYDSGTQLFCQLPINLSLLAQTVKDPDLMGTWQRAFDNFIQSGQVWALLIGLVVGYMLRGLTTYG